eukprot:UN15463
MQYERLDSLTYILIKNEVILYRKMGLNVFLESATLIGWQRHNKNHMPWDTDSDVGMLRTECEKSNITKESLQIALPKRLKVIKFGCTCLEDCTGDSERIVGRVMDTTTGT